MTYDVRKYPGYTEMIFRNRKSTLTRKKSLANISTKDNLAVNLYDFYNKFYFFMKFDGFEPMVNVYDDQQFRTNDVDGAVAHYPEEQRQRILSDSELEALKTELAVAINRKKEMIYTVSAIKILLMTTARKNEILTGQWTRLDWERQILFQPQSKTGWKPIYLNDTAIKILKQLYERPERELNDYIFKGQGYKSHLKSVKTAWGTMLKNAGIDDYRIHDLRHQRASICVENGESLYIVSKMLGHKSQRTTERYAYLSQKPIQKAAELLADVVNF